jgi:CBS domain-containing protein
MPRWQPEVEVYVMKVSEVMSKRPACCWPSSSALTAAIMMRERDIGILPVAQDRFTPKLVGVVTDRDLCLHVVAAARDPAHVWISECMTEDPVCCNAEEDTRRAIDLMKNHQIRRLPVVDEKHEIVGMVSLSDLVRKADLDAEIVSAALRGICEPGSRSRTPVEPIIQAA